MKIALLWAHFGPYHMARLKALQQRSEVLAIQYAAGELKYGWRSAPEGNVVTLCSGSAERAPIWKTCRRLWARLQDGSPNVVLLPGYYTLASLLAAVWALLNGKPAVMMSDSTLEDLTRTSWKEKIKSVIVRRLFAGIFVSGKRAHQYACLLGLGTVPCAWKYDVVDNAHFERQAHRCAPLSAPNHFIYVGRLAPEKNVAMLLSAFALYKSRGGQWDLQIIGFGALESELRSTASQLQVDGYVKFQGQKSYEDLPDLYAGAACLVLPSASEPWGLVVNEAMAAGLPVLVSKQCGCSDDLVQNGLNGFTFDHRYPEELAALLLQTQNISPSGLSAMGLRSREIIACYTPEEWASQAADVCRRLVEGDKIP